MQSADIAIAGAGLIGLSLALELHRLGARVVLFDSAQPGFASRAAAGMLAVDDPHNPPQLHALSTFSRSLYPEFLDRIADFSGHRVALQTQHTIQVTDLAEEDAAEEKPALLPTQSFTNYRLLTEQSLDPRELHTALRQAIKNAGIPIQSGPFQSRPAIAVDCTGAWSRHFTSPAKGQMLRVALDGQMHHAELGNLVLRTEDLYIVPRLDGTALIGATVEDIGFDLKVHPEDIYALHDRAAGLLPSLAATPILDTWSGLRPRTYDDLPLLGQLADGFIATGHFRNGVLLAPGTASVLASLILTGASPVDLSPFRPNRF